MKAAYRSVTFAFLLTLANIPRLERAVVRHGHQKSQRNIHRPCIG